MTDRDWHPEIGYVEIRMCEEVLNDNISHDHDLELVDITGRAEIKCQTCLEEDANLALSEVHPRFLLDEDDQEDGESLFASFGIDADDY